MSVRLRKDQIDKASKEHSGRFAEDFAVTLVLFKPDDQTSPHQNEVCTPSENVQSIVRDDKTSPIQNKGCKPSDNLQSIANGHVRCGGWD